MMPAETWHPMPCKRKFEEREVLADAATHAAGQCIAIVETFGNGWYANALPPHADGTSSTVPGMVRAGNMGEHLEEARAWCERICGLYPEKPGDRQSEPSALATGSAVPTPEISGDG